MIELPAKVHEPLHILPPYLYVLLKLLWYLFWTFIIFAVLAYLWSKIKNYLQNKQQLPVQKKGGKPIKKRITDVKDFYSRSGEFRKGCHVLSALMKSHFEEITGYEIEEMTVSEIKKIFNKKEPYGFFRKLANLQYGIQEPDRDDFLLAIQDARRAARINKEKLIQVSSK